MSETGIPEPLAEALGNVRVRAWSCLIPEHRDRKTVTVEWRGGVAHCTQPGCDLTSEHTQRFAQVVRDHLATQVEQARADAEPGGAEVSRDEFCYELAPHLSDALECIGFEDVALHEGRALADVLFCLGYRKPGQTTLGDSVLRERVEALAEELEAAEIADLRDHHSVDLRAVLAETAPTAE